MADYRIPSNDYSSHNNATTWSSMSSPAVEVDHKLVKSLQAMAAKKLYYTDTMAPASASAVDTSLISTKSTKMSGPKLPPATKADPTSPKILSELQMLMMCYQATMLQRTNVEVGRELQIDGLVKKTEYKQALKKKDYENQDKMFGLAEQQATAEKVSLALSITTVGLALVGIFAAVFTGGTSLTLTLAALQGGVGLSQGGAQIAITKIKAALSELQAEQVVLRAKIDENAQRSKSELQDTKHDGARISELIKFLSALLEAYQRATK